MAGWSRARPDVTAHLALIVEQAHERSVRLLLAQYRALRPGAEVRLAKTTSNLFRFRPRASDALDVSGFSHVLAIDAQNRTADVQGMITYADLVDATLTHGLMPMVVPQLKTITLGGAVAGLGIESTSFRNGLPHESVREMEILTGDGEVVLARPDNEHAELFRGFPNSYGTLGYALRLVIDLEPVQPFVALRHLRFNRAEDCFAALAEICAAGAHDGTAVDFVDGVCFGPDELYLTLATFAESAPQVSDYTGMDIYYQSIRSRDTDHLTVHDYLWRWDTDWFWCSRALGVQHPAVRRLWPRRYRRSDVYRKLVAFDRRHRLTERWDSRLGRPPQEPVVQDVEVPVAAGAKFLDFFDRRHRHLAGLAVPAAAARPQPVAAVPAGTRRALRQPGLLVECAVAAGPARRSPQPADRGDRDRARRAQVALLDGVLFTRGILATVQRTVVYAVEGCIRPGQKTARPVRQVCGPSVGVIMALSQAFEHLVGSSAPVRFRAYDGSSAGPPDAAASIEIRSPRALNYIVTSPGGLGLARAYVVGDLEVVGDLYTAMSSLTNLDLDLSWPEKLRALRALGGIGLLYPPPRPELEVRLRGRRHSRRRDQAAIAHHYDVSNRFYEQILGPSMTYTCAVYPTADSTLEQAQWAKHELVARKLGLQPGMRLLDVGCGWGGMVMHAAREHGVQALGVTLSRRQAEWAQKAIAEAGLSDLRRGTAPGLPGRARAPVRRDQLDRPHRTHRTRPTRRLLPVPAPPAAPRRTAPQPLHHPAQQPGTGDAQTAVHQPVHLPRR